MDLAELLARARRLEGCRLCDLAASLGLPVPGPGARTKGKIGELVERALGATGGARPEPDFPELGLELKTVPVDGALRPRESTYVCRIRLDEAERADWESSWVRRKLSQVLFVPVIDRARIGPAVLWRPTAEQERILKADFDELIGAIGAGQIEELDARRGTFLQLRPKARHGRVRTVVWDPDGVPISTVPRGLYLRARFIGSILRSQRRGTPRPTARFPERSLRSRRP